MIVISLFLFCLYFGQICRVGGIRAGEDGRVDLRARVSNDNGATWEDITTVIAGKGKDSPDFMNVGSEP